MPSPPREIRSWRPAITWLLPLATAALVLVVRSSGTLSLAPPSSTPALTDAVAIGLARLFRTTPIGVLLQVGNNIALVAAVATLVRAALVVGASPLPAAATGVAFGLLKVFAPALSPFDAIVPAAAAWLGMGLVAQGEDGSSWTIAVRAALLGAVLPIAAIPAAVAVGLSRKRLEWRVALMALAPIVAAWVGLAASPALPPLAAGAAAAPFGFETFSVVAFVTQARAVALAGGPYGAGLALVGAIALGKGWGQTRTWAAAIVAVAPLVVDHAGTAALVRIAGPALVGFSALIALGLTEILRAGGSSLQGRAGAAALVVLLPVLQVIAQPDRVAAALVPRGHDTLSSNDFRNLLMALPDHAIVVREDASTDVLLRAAHSALGRLDKPIEIIDRDDPALSHLTSASTPVVALPSAAEELRWKGFELTPAAFGPKGLATLRARGGCIRVARSWTDVSAAITPGAFAVVVPSIGDEGPIAIYAAVARPRPAPLGWPGFTTRGFNIVTYAHDRADDRDRLAQDAANDGMPGAWAARLHDADVARFELWRTPDAPLLLGVRAGDAGTFAVARLEPEAAAQHLSLCPAFPYDVVSIGPR